MLASGLVVQPLVALLVQREPQALPEQPALLVQQELRARQDQEPQAYPLKLHRTDSPGLQALLEQPGPALQGLGYQDQEPQEHRGPGYQDQEPQEHQGLGYQDQEPQGHRGLGYQDQEPQEHRGLGCLLYTSDAADE